MSPYLKKPINIATFPVKCNRAHTGTVMSLWGSCIGLVVLYIGLDRSVSLSHINLYFFHSPLTFISFFIGKHFILKKMVYGLFLRTLSVNLLGVWYFYTVQASPTYWTV